MPAQSALGIPDYQLPFYKEQSHESHEVPRMPNPPPPSVALSSALYKAVYNNDLAEVSRLVNKKGVDPKRDVSGRDFSAIQAAILKDNADILYVLTGVLEPSSELLYDYLRCYLQSDSLRYLLDFGRGTPRQVPPPGSPCLRRLSKGPRNARHLLERRFAAR